MTKTVLIVDDVPFIRKALRQILTDAHYHVVGEAADGGEAVSLYSKLRPSVVTMDIVMPEMSGIDATRKIMALDSDARVVIISAMGQENLVMEAIHVGAKDYLLKPFTAADVIKTIERALRDDSYQAGRASLRDNKTSE